jgi:hypothetical protein
MLARSEVYKDHTIDFGERRAKKNASRWIQQLKRLDLVGVNEGGDIVAKAEPEVPAKKAKAKPEVPAKKAKVSA